MTGKSTLKKLGRYDVLEKIADTTLGTIYKGRERDSGAVVALKVVTLPKADDGSLWKRFEQEIRLARTLHHPHIVRGLDFGQEGPHLFLVMEFVDGECLDELIETSGRVPEEEAIRILEQIGQALHQLHQQGIVHRHVKPANILISSDGQAKLADLGLINDKKANIDLTRPSKDSTPNFMAPEQFNSAKQVDVRCDVYSLGATLYMAVTGELPFRARAAITTLKKKLNNEITPPRQLVSSLSTTLDQAIRRALRADPDQRYASCLEFIQGLSGTRVEEVAAQVSTPAKARVFQPVQPPTVSEKDRRASRRFLSSVTSSCQPIGGEPDSWPAKVVDISTTGICLLIGRRFEPGTVLTVELLGSKPWFERTVLARVVRVRAQSRKWLTGCLFSSQLIDDEIQALL